MIRSLDNNKVFQTKSLHLTTDRLTDRLAAHLLAQIESGELAPGDRLPTQQQLADAHGVSQGVVREAVHQLRSRGILASRQGSGVYVSAQALSKPLAFDPQVLDSLSSVVQIVEVRRAIEGEIAALAAVRADARQVSEIRRALGAIETAVEKGGDGVEEDLAFHRAIAEASSNSHFTLLLKFLEQYQRAAMHVTRGNEARYYKFAKAVREEHIALVEAIERRDPVAARRLAAKHMEQAAHRLEAAGIVRSSPAPEEKDTTVPKKLKTRGNHAM